VVGKSDIVEIAVIVASGAVILQYELALGFDRLLTAWTYVTSIVLTVVGVDKVETVVVFEVNEVSFSLQCI